MSRFPRKVYDCGDEPDPRFSLANERTFLAWCRTSFAIVSLGIALDNVTVAMAPRLKTAVVVLALLVGSALPILAWIDWARTERAMRLSDPLPESIAQFVFAIVTTVCAVCVACGMVISWMGAR